MDASVGPAVESRAPSGSNSAVECDLPKVEVAGSNPVSRSIPLERTADDGPMPQVIVVPAEAVAALLPMDRCIELMATALAGLAKGEALNPLRVGYQLPSGHGLVVSMPGALGDPPVFGAKLLSVFPGNRSIGLESHQGVIVLFEGHHGRVRAIVDASSITAIRTAAVSGLATRLLAREDASELAILGAGTQAQTHLEAMLAVRTIRRAKVWSPTPERLQAFVAGARERHGIEVEAGASAQEAVEGAGIVCTVTAAREPVLHGSDLAAGMHINAVGSSVPTAREVDSEVIARSRLFVDRRESALNESGDLLGAIRDGEVEERHVVAELGEVVVGTAQGRGSADEITLFESLGLAVEDLAAAWYVAETATERGMGATVEL
jgi:alanine dehydrogenase